MKNRNYYIGFSVILLTLYLTLIFIFYLSLVPLLFLLISYICFIISYFTTKLNYHFKIVITLVLYFISVLIALISFKDEPLLNEYIISIWCFPTIILPLGLVKKKDKLIPNLLIILLTFILTIFVTSALACAYSSLFFFKWLTLSLGLISVLVITTILVLNTLTKSSKIT